MTITKNNKVNIAENNTRKQNQQYNPRFFQTIQGIFSNPIRS